MIARRLRFLGYALIYHSIEFVAALKSLGKHHVGSFNYMLDEGLKLAVQDIDPIEFIYEATGEKTKNSGSQPFLVKIPLKI